ncbi:MAG: Nicotinamide-nucleotide amidohydrolase PncC [Candidatus Erwinia impunctatus]
MEKISITTLATDIGQRLQAESAMLTTAESCTGGGIAQAVTEIAGSSQWFGYGFVTYSNQAKSQLLDVPPSLIELYGAVSEPVVIAMAQGALSRSVADYAIAVSGIAGPGGGTPEKPTGTVWFGFTSRKGHIYSACQRFCGDRAAVREQAVHWALLTLRDHFL